MIATQLIRDHLWSAPERSPADADAFTDRAHARATLLVRAFYGVSLLWTVQAMSTWPQLLDSTVLDPQWPAEWIDVVGTRTGVAGILIAYTALSVAAATLPRWRLLRVGYSASLLLYLSLANGLGKIGHGMHGWLWVSAFLVLLPTTRDAWSGGRRDREARRTFLQVISLAQLCVLFFYTLTGLWKLYYAARALAGPGISAFELDGFSYLIADNLLTTGRDTLVGDLLVRNPAASWFLFNATIYLEAASVLVVLRPRLHRLWGFGLLLFHLGTQAAMGILFPANIVLLSLLLLCSPSAPDEVDLRATVLDLPGIHLVARWWARRRRREPTSVPVPVPTSAP